MTTLKFNYNGIKKDGKLTRVWYSKGNFDPKYGIPENTITIYARDYNAYIPKELNPENHSDSMTDYFETDHARVRPTDPFYPQVHEAYLKQEAHRDKIRAKRGAR